MKKIFALLIIISSTNTPAQDSFDIDYTMSEKCINWLEYINTSPDTNSIKNYFMDSVATTEGCKTIIAHWARFRDWNNEIFYDFVAKALDLRQASEETTNKDGSLTRFGERRRLWQNAQHNTEQLRKDIETLKAMNLPKRCEQIARMYLPADVELKNDFYVVLFGASNAFSVGDRNGFDLLQMARFEDGLIDSENVALTFAHELHHTGFSSAAKKHVGNVYNNDKIMLVGIVTAEGMATYFINKTYEKLEHYENLQQNIYKDVAADWKTHLKNVKSYYDSATVHIRKSLDGTIDREKIISFWLDGAVGRAYAVGVDMFSVIEKYLGAEEAINIANDFRQLLSVYNCAARIGLSNGDNLYLFDDDLVERVSQVN